MDNRAFVISLIILVSSIAISLSAASRRVPMVIETNLENLPMHIMGYQATEDSFSVDVYKELNADKNIFRHYQSSNTQQIDLYIGYYGTAKGGRSSHNPYACFSGAGWGINDTSKILLDSMPATEVNYMLINKSGFYQVVLHWYQQGGRIISTGWKMNLDRFKNLLMNNRNDGAFVRISMNSDQQHLASTVAQAKTFAAHIAAVIPHYWPEER